MLTICTMSLHTPKRVNIFGIIVYSLGQCIK